MAKRWLILVALLLLVGIPMAIAQTAEQPAADEPKAAEPEKQGRGEAFEKGLAAVKQGQARVRTLSDFTAVFHKHEWKGGKMLNPETVFMKWRKNPRSVYMSWIGDHNKGQEILWVKGKNDDKIKAHTGGFLKLINANLDPTGSMAMKESRHPVMHAGFDHTVKLIAKDMKLAEDHPDWSLTVEDLGNQSIHGRKSYCFKATMDKKNHPEFYAYQALICTDIALKIPNKVHIWDFEDGQVRLVEQYSYEKVKLNVGLTDKDFDPENDEYSF